MNKSHMKIVDMVQDYLSKNLTFRAIEVLEEFPDLQGRARDLKIRLRRLEDNFVHDTITRETYDTKYNELKENILNIAFAFVDIEPEPNKTDFILSAMQRFKKWLSDRQIQAAIVASTCTILVAIGPTLFSIFSDWWLSPSNTTPSTPQNPVASISTPGIYSCENTFLESVQCKALERLHFATNGSQWITQTNWLKTEPCQWYGVTCKGKSVIKLELSDNNLDGVIPEELAELNKLETLNLSNNTLNKMPTVIRGFTNLVDLDFSSNELTSLPSEIGTLSQLDILKLNDNQLADLPPEIGNLANLTELYLNDNLLSNLPPEIADLTNLRDLWLGSNQLISFPLSISKLDKLTALYLYDNPLKSLPSEIGNLEGLTELSLSYTQLSSLPPEIGNLSNLNWVSLNGNQLSSLPDEIGNLEKLWTIELPSNRLSSLPDTFLDLENLEKVDIDNNHFVSVSSELQIFLGKKAPGWSATQSMPEATISATTIITALELITTTQE